MGEGWISKESNEHLCEFNKIMNSIEVGYTKLWDIQSSIWHNFDLNEGWTKGNSFLIYW